MSVKNWKYNKDVETQNFELIAVGNYRCRIAEAEETTSKAGNEMIKLVIELPNNRKLWHYIVFFPEGVDKNGNPKSDITNRNLKDIFNAFGIDEGDLNINNWIGKVGGLKVKHEADQNGEMQARIHYFLNKNQTDILPAWGENPQPKADNDGWT